MQRYNNVTTLAIPKNKVFKSFLMRNLGNLHIAFE